MKMSSEQFADEMIKDFAPKIKPVTKTQVEEVEEKLNQKMKEAAAEEEPELELVDDPEEEAPEYDEPEEDNNEEVE
jgi:hypothetical protein